MAENANNDPLGKALNVSPISKITNKDIIETIKADAEDDSAKTDFEAARQNMQVVLDTTQAAIKELGELAGSTGSARMYEVLAKLADSSVNVSKSLLDLQEKIREIKSAAAPINGKTITNNNLFVGTTAEMQKILQNMAKNNKVIDGKPGKSDDSI